MRAVESKVSEVTRSDANGGKTVNRCSDTQFDPAQKEDFLLGASFNGSRDGAQRSLGPIPKKSWVQVSLRFAPPLLIVLLHDFCPRQGSGVSKNFSFVCINWRRASLFPERFQLSLWTMVQRLLPVHMLS